MTPDPTPEPTPDTPQTVARPHLQIFPLGDFQTNCLIVTQGQPLPGKPCLIVDCGYEPAPLIDAVESQQLKPALIVLTHAHADHIAGLTELHSRLGPVPIVMHQAEENWLNDPMLNLSAALGRNVTAPAPERFIGEGDTVALEDLIFDIHHTPGHSPGSITLHHGPSKTAIVGDTLFMGSIGRTDFPGSSFETLADSIRTRLYTLDPETACHPGHGPSTTVGREMQTNPYVRPE